MKRRILSVSLVFFLLASCSGSKNTVTTQKKIIPNEQSFANTITASELKTHLTIIASDDMEGRDTGSKGQKKAGNYLIAQYKKMGIPFPKGAESYYQNVPAEFMNKEYDEHLPDSENIWAFIEGSEKPDEIIVVSAHYDHVGMKNGVVYNGADDDGSGTVALLEIAQAFQKAKEQGQGPKRSILFLHMTGEEHGLYGSSYYSEHPLFPIEKTVADVNIDMIGRRDNRHSDSNYIYLIGSDYLSSDLFTICEEANAKFTQLAIDYKYNDRKDPNRFYYRSDHYNFAKHRIPVVFLFNGTHADYHKETDDVDKIEFDALSKRAQLGFTIAWELANRPTRIVVDKSGN
ncbi:M28 family metallopeptidase [Flavobacterium aciduliphilum]|uniref:Peptidase M28-like protein n=1 Tax=Flavobacterium aciduliphilum TaxID=1101402 RepID=A0A328YPS0_9FLAO|nr:M28 family metallopeptidase [Flavobacterium aciduliphilum]RAR75354.1 peptidase M28-like protein [Flavobacterium aciduliphilum]